MAPLPESRKRAASNLLDEKHHLKRQKRHYHHVHNTKVKQQSDISHILNDPEAITNQLRRSIGLILRTIGFADATPEALETFTVAAEEYIDHLLKYVRISMEAGRRTQAIPSDFEFALESHLLTLDSLVCHLNPPTARGPKSRQLVTPRIEARAPVADRDRRLLDQFFLSLRGPEAETRLIHAPKQFPALPSRHTYKSTPTEAGGPKDTRTIRERATEESRLGEEALRRLVSARRGKEKSGVNGLSKTTAYQACMQMLETEAQQDQDRVDLRRMDLSGPPANAESRYWRSAVKIKKAIPNAHGGRDPD